MSRMSRAKGASAELEVAALLQPWWRKLEPEILFRRTPASGGWSTPDARQAWKVSGDLMTNAKRFPWSVEVKRRENWSLANMMLGRRSPVWGWWEQTQRAAAEVDLEPMLWFRKSHGDWMIGVPDRRAETFLRMRRTRVIRSQGWIGLHGASCNVFFAEEVLVVHPARLALPRAA